MAQDGAYHAFDEDESMQHSVFMSDRSVRFDTWLPVCRALLPTSLPSFHHLPGPQHSAAQHSTAQTRSELHGSHLLVQLQCFFFRHSVKIAVAPAAALAFIDRAKSGLLKRARSWPWTPRVGCSAKKEPLANTAVLDDAFAPSPRPSHADGPFKCQVSWCDCIVLC